VFVSKNIDTIQKDLDELSPKDRVNVLVDLIQYINPEIKSRWLSRDNLIPRRSRILKIYHGGIERLFEQVILVDNNHYIRNVYIL